MCVDRDPCRERGFQTIDLAEGLTGALVAAGRRSACWALSNSGAPKPTVQAAVAPRSGSLSVNVRTAGVTVSRNQSSTLTFAANDSHTYQKTPHPMYC